MTVRVKLVSHTPDPEIAVALAARACIRDLDHTEILEELEEEDVARLIATVVAKKHFSVLEHVSFTFAISGVSRVLSHQLVRHRIASYSQLSQQRADSSSLSYVVPPMIRSNESLLCEYHELMDRCQRLYRRMTGQGLLKGSSRYVLPSAFTTRILTTINARSLFNLIEQRACAAEEWEFREVAIQMHRRLMRVAPNIFRFAGTTCETSGFCLEGEVGADCARSRRYGAIVRNKRSDILRVVRNANGRD